MMRFLFWVALSLWAIVAAASPVYSYSIPVSAGATSAPVIVQSYPVAVTAIPGGGGTVTVQYTTSPLAAITAGSATWQNWPSGAVSSTTTDAPNGPITAVRASAATAGGTLEVAE